MADFIRIKLTGLATRLGQSTVQPFDGCVRDVAIAGFARPRSVAEVLASQATTLVR